MRWGCCLLKKLSHIHLPHLEFILILVNLSFRKIPWNALPMKNWLWRRINISSPWVIIYWLPSFLHKIIQISIRSKSSPYFVFWSLEKTKKLLPFWSKSKIIAPCYWLAFHPERYFRQKFQLSQNLSTWLPSMKLQHNSSGNFNSTYF